LERTVEASHTVFRPGGGAAFSVDDGEGEQLVLVHEVSRCSPAELAEAIRSARWAVAEEHDVEIHAVVLLKKAAVPKTSSGKVQRRECRQRFLEQTFDAVYQWSADCLLGATA
jgi:acyl-CoA synthetase (AMP-forming)/AMP-acid ligase II